MNPRMFAATILLLAPLACAPKSQPTMKQTPVANKTAEQANASYDPSAVDRLVESFAQKARALPGRTAEEHRDAMRGVFDDLTQLLPLFEGPDPSGAFRQQLRTIETARDRLAAGSSGTSAEPAIDTGLRAAQAAFARLGADEDFADATTKDLLGKISAKVDEIDNVQTVGRPYVAADATQLMSDLARHMAERLGAGSTGSTVAATEPAATEPAATEPAATEPTPAPPASEPAPADAKPVDSAPAEAPAAKPEAAAPAPEEKPATEKPAEVKPAEEKPADAKPAEDVNK